MTRPALALALPLLVAASAPSLDVNRGVELVNAAPSDFRAILAVMFLLLVGQGIQSWWSNFRATKAAERGLEKIAASTDKLADTLAAMASGNVSTTAALRTDLERVLTELRELREMQRGKQ